MKQTGSKTADYTYDKENRLLKAAIRQGSSVTAEFYTYDYEGNRISRTVNGDDTTFYVNDTSTDLTMVVAETDGNGEETAYYTRGDELLSMDSYQGSIYDPVSLHKYLYVNANPVMYTDPSGYSGFLVAGMGAMTSSEIVEVQNDAIMFNIGINLIKRLWAVKAVEATSYFTTTVLCYLVIDDALNQRYFTDAYDVVVEIMQYALDNIETICNRAGITNETISEQIRIAIYEAKKKGKKGKKEKNERDVDELGDANINDLDKLPDDKIEEVGGEDYTQKTKRGSGKSKSDLYWTKKEIYILYPKKEVPHNG